jgi:prolipoprotein diacylglyceryltransferase
MSALPDWMWAFRYPHNVLKESVPIDGCSYEYCRQLAEPVFPTPFYEVLMMCGVFAILWALRKRIKTVGMLFFIYLGLIAIERFIIEKIRVNVVHDVLGFQLTQAEIISIVLFCVSLGGMVYVSKFRKDSSAEV